MNRKLILVTVINFFIYCNTSLAAVSCDGDDTIDSGSYALALSANEAFTIYVKFRTTNNYSTTWDAIHGFFGSANDFMELGIGTAGGGVGGANDLFFLIESSNEQDFENYVGTFNTGDWFVLICGRENAGNIFCYVNSTTKNSDTANTSIMTNATGYDVCSRTGGEGFIGDVAEFAIWEGVELNSTEVSLLLNSKIRIAHQIQPSFLKTYLHLNDIPNGNGGDLFTAKDFSRSGNNYTYNNGANNSGMTGLAEPVLSYPNP